MNYLHEQHNLSIRRSCEACGISQSSYYYKAKLSTADELIKEQLTALAQKHRRWGCKKMYSYLKNKGHQYNHKRVRKVYCELALNLRVKPKKHFKKRVPEVLIQPLKKNDCWSIDFMSDALMSGVKFRTLNVIDDYNREGVGIKVAFSLTAEAVTQQIDKWAKTRGYPENIRVDNGPEFTSSHFQQWAKKHGITLHFIQPGKPSQNAYIERFNRTYREEILDAQLFYSTKEAELISKEWLEDYNHERPHQSLKQLSPIDFANKREALLKGEIAHL